MTPSKCRARPTCVFWPGVPGRISRRMEVRVPVGSGEAALAALAEIPAGERVLYIRHHIRKGETLSVIARRYRVSVGAIQRANRLGRRTMIRAGKTLVIPTIAAGSYDYAPATAWSDPGGNGSVVTYRVRRGDTLSQIARRYPGPETCAERRHRGRVRSFGPHRPSRRIPVEDRPSPRHHRRDPLQS